MSWWRRRRATPTVNRAEQRAEVNLVRDHLEQFITTREGVEAFIEPPTNMSPPTILLIASTGEWTRRRVPHEGLIRELAENRQIPVYDVNKVGYPQRMREWNTRARQAARDAEKGTAPST